MFSVLGCLISRKYRQVLSLRSFQVTFDDQARPVLKPVSIILKYNPLEKIVSFFQFQSLPVPRSLASFTVSSPIESLPLGAIRHVRGELLPQTLVVQDTRHDSLQCLHL